MIPFYFAVSYDLHFSKLYFTLLIFYVRVLCFKPFCIINLTLIIELVLCSFTLFWLGLAWMRIFNFFRIILHLYLNLVCFRYFMSIFLCSIWRRLWCINRPEWWIWWIRYTFPSLIISLFNIKLYLRWLDIVKQQFVMNNSVLNVQMVTNIQIVSY
jgi:hypothetical protein